MLCYLVKSCNIDPFSEDLRLSNLRDSYYSRPIRETLRDRELFDSLDDLDAVCLVVVCLVVGLLSKSTALTGTIFYSRDTFGKHASLGRFFGAYF